MADMAKSRPTQCLRALSQSHVTKAFAALSLDEIREVVEVVDELEPEALSGWKNPRRAVLLRSLVQLWDDDLKRAWRDFLSIVAVDAMAKTTKAQRAKLDGALRALAQVPNIVTALQITIVSDGDWNRWTPELWLLPVLALDGSDASADALMVVFTKAQALEDFVGERDALFERLAALKSFAPPMALESLFGAVHALQKGHAQARQQSPVLQLAQSLGLGTLHEFRVECVQASAATASDGSPAVRVNVRFANTDDSPLWLDVSVEFLDTIKVNGFSRFRSRRTAFGSESDRVVDELGLGTCLDVAKLPRWLESMATTLEMTFTTTVTTNVRGKKKARVETWLLGGGMH